MAFDLALNPIFKDPAVRKAAEDLARSSFEYYVYFSFLLDKRRPFLKNWHHKEICNFMQRVYDGEIKRGIINIPPRYSKTELVVKKFTEWTMGKNPACEFIHTTYAAPLARRNSGEILSRMQSDWYRSIFPDVLIDPNTSGKGEWKTTRGGCFYATGMNGSITGFGAGKTPNPGQPWTFDGAILVDDPHKPKGAESDVQRQTVIDFYSDTLESRTNDPANTPIIIIQQRLDEKDLSGFLLAGGSGDVWEELIIPIEDDDGVPLWEAKHTREMIQKLRDSNPTVFAAQYNQRPRLKGGNLLKGEWFRRYTEIPPLSYRFIVADTAQKKKKANDYSVLMHAGIRRDNGNLVILEILRGKWEAPELTATARSYWQKCKDMKSPELGQLREMTIEDKSSGTGLIQYLRRGEPGKYPPIPVKPIPRDIDKLTRVMDAAPQVEIGRVEIPHEKLGLVWVKPFVEECEGFRADDKHEHDDQVDCLCDGVARIGSGVDVYSAL